MAISKFLTFNTVLVIHIT